MMSTYRKPITSALLFALVAWNVEASYGKSRTVDVLAMSDLTCDVSFMLNVILELH